jgi:hypothetical protein
MDLAKSSPAFRHKKGLGSTIRRRRFGRRPGLMESNGS